MSRQNKSADRQSERIGVGAEILFRRQFVRRIYAQRIAAASLLGLLLLRHDGLIQLGLV